MKKSYLILAMIVFFVVAGSGMVSYADTVNVPATATVEAGTLTLAQTTDLDFGTIIAGTLDSNILINASAGAATPVVDSGNAAVSGGTSGFVDVGTNIDAIVNISYSIKGDTNSEPDELDNATDSMSIQNISTNSTGSPLSITVAGPNEIHVGGVLTVTSTQATGTYAGTCVVTVNYQ